MSCEDVRELLSALLDGALSPEEESRVREHILTCEACREEMEELEGVVGLVRAIPKPEAPDGFGEGVLARLPRRKGRRPLLWLAPVAAAACLLVLVKLASTPPPPVRGPEVARGVPARKVQPPEDDVGFGAQHEPEKPKAEDRSEPGMLEETTLDKETARREGGPTRPRVGMEKAGDRAGERAQDDPAPAAEAAAPQADATGARPDSAAGAPPDSPAGAPPEAEAEAPPEEKPPGIRAPATPPAPRDGDELAVGRRYELAGAEPDAAAGWILAELRHRRDRRRLDALEERLERDEAGEPSLLELTLSPDEIEFVEDLVEERGARLDRTNGAAAREAPKRGKAKARDGYEEKRSDETEESDDERMKVVIRLSRER